MDSIEQLLANNQQWAKEKVSENPDFFAQLAQGQTPKYLWIGCADSRVPPNQVLGLDPGEIFVHRNIANVVVHTDVNCLSVMQYAVEALKVEHIIVCGHYKCGGVQAALENPTLGLIDNWLRHIQTVANQHRTEIDAIDDPALRVQRMCELNAIHQARNVCQTTIVQQCWQRGQSLSIHPWVYDLSDGIIHKLHDGFRSAESLDADVQSALSAKQ